MMMVKLIVTKVSKIKKCCLKEFNYEFNKVFFYNILFLLYLLHFIKRLL